MNDPNPGNLLIRVVPTCCCYTPFSKHPLCHTLYTPLTLPCQNAMVGPCSLFLLFFFKSTFHIFSNFFFTFSSFQIAKFVNVPDSEKAFLFTSSSMGYTWKTGKI